MKRTTTRGTRDTKPRAPINDNIRAKEVRLIDSEGQQVGVVTLQEALASAVAAGLDLVQIADADPIVCKVMDYGKYLFEQKKAKASQKKKQKQVQVKEIKFRPGTEDGDYQVKLRNLIRFLEDGDKAKISMRFRGREMAHQDVGMRLFERLEKDLEEHALVEARPRLEGRQMVMVLAPKKRK